MCMASLPANLSYVHTRISWNIILLGKSSFQSIKLQLEMLKVLLRMLYSIIILKMLSYNNASIIGKPYTHYQMVWYWFMDVDSLKICVDNVNTKSSKSLIAVSLLSTVANLLEAAKKSMSKCQPAILHGHSCVELKLQQWKAYNSWRKDFQLFELRDPYFTYLVHCNSAPTVEGSTQGKLIPVSWKDGL